ncbi:MAG: hypothetical protein WCK93_02615 [Nitrosomonadales bacterium]|jgi:hypothetical protein
MYEGFILIALVALVVLAIRTGKAQPVIIHQAGYLHATLAPQLQRTQCFLAQIASSFAGDKTGDIATRYFDLRDQGGRYLLAAGLRSGVFYFQVILPPLKGDEAHTLRAFAEAVMANIPLQVTGDGCLPVESVAKAHKISCLELSD